MNTPDFRIIPLDAAIPSPSNPRKHYDDEKTAELAESLRTQGIIQPLVVREAAKGKGKFETVCGERRRRAAKLAKLESLPVVVRELDDAQVLEIQIVENSQREDVSALEESDGYAALHKLGRTVEEIAAKVGRSQSHIYQRLRLHTLVPEGREAFFKGRIDAAGAQYIVRIANPEAQARAIKEILESYRYEQDEAILVDDIRDIVRRKYLLVLLEAPFPRDDAALLEGAGPCTTCSKRSGAQASLFGEGEDPKDQCLDVVCYERKSTAVWERTAAAAEEGGAKILPEGEIKKVFPYGHGTIAHGSSYALLSARCDVDPKRRTYAEILGDDADKSVVMARDPDGGIHKLVPKTAVKPFLAEERQADPEVARQAKREDKHREAQKLAEAESRRKQARRRAVTVDLISETVRTVTEKGLSRDALGALALCTIARSHHETQVDVCKRRKLYAKDAKALEKARPDALLKQHLDQLRKDKNPNKVLALIVELLVSQGAYYAYAERTEERLEAVAKSCGIDPAAITKAVRATETRKDAA